MKYYIASKLENEEAVQDLRDRLQVLGHEVTYDWTEHGSVKGEGTERCRAVAHAELGGVRDADLVFVIWPGGRGTHVELGAAIALDKLVVLCCPDELMQPDDKTCAFYHHSNVIHYAGPLAGAIVFAEARDHSHRRKLATVIGAKARP